MPTQEKQFLCPACRLQPAFDTFLWQRRGEALKVQVKGNKNNNNKQQMGLPGTEEFLHGKGNHPQNEKTNN